MKKIYSILAVLFITASVVGQAPQSMSYQAVIRSSNDALVVSTPVGLKISMLQGSNIGTAVYVETQTAATDLNGLVSIAIGTGTIVSGSFAGINWAAGPYFIKTEIDPTGGTNYSITGTEQTTSVPYGLYIENGVQPGTAAGQMEYWNGSTWIKIEPVVNATAKLLLINGVPAWVVVPGAPSIGTAIPQNGQSTITYTAPAYNGGSDIISYTATSAPGGFTGTMSQAGSGTITVTGLTNGTAYTFTVTATNAAGTSTASAVSNSVTPRTIPGAPTIGTATAGAGQSTITYTAPVSNGGGAITSYTATSAPGGFTGTVSQAGSGTITVSGLTNGAAYTFTVTATNAAGTSAASAVSNSVTPRTVPSAPTIGTATLGAGQATIAYTAPANNGGAAITSYTATASPGGLTGTVSQAGSGTITVTGLTNGTAYTFTVRATNAAGTSAASAPSNSVTPRTVPGAPTIGTATLGTVSATIAYTAPASNGGAAITSYTATSSPGGLWGTQTQAGSSTILVSGLTNGIAYTFTVTATNAVGTSAASAVSNSVTPLAHVFIGTQVWTFKNLDVTTYTDGTVIPQVTDPTAWAALTTGAWCYYANVTANGTTYGKLYNWYAVAGIYDAASSTNTALRKKLAPTGWHVPSYTEWDNLIQFLGGSNVAGGKMKSTGTTLWTTNTGATNSSGFTALPGGERASNGSFYFIGTRGHWWGSNTYAGLTVSEEYIMEGSSTSTTIIGNASTKCGFSVRCVRD
jgi:uncharacterized protein (TIGR02145 family)